MAQTVKRLSTMRETWVRSLGQEDPLEKEIAIHSSTIAWRIPWTEEPGRLQFMGSQRVGHDWATSLSLWLNQLRLSGCFIRKSIYGVTAQSLAQTTLKIITFNMKLRDKENAKSFLEKVFAVAAGTRGEEVHQGKIMVYQKAFLKSNTFPTSNLTYFPMPALKN